MVVVAQLVRAPGCGPGGRRFESGLPPQSWLCGGALGRTSVFCALKTLFSAQKRRSARASLDGGPAAIRAPPALVEWLPSLRLLAPLRHVASLRVAQEVAGSSPVYHPILILCPDQPSDSGLFCFRHKTLC